MKIHFLGTGAAGGVPLYGCRCHACMAAQQDAALIRRPCSALLEHGDTRLLIDAGLMDLHERFAPGALTGILLTHYHPDHVQGLFHLRWGVNHHIDVVGPPDSEGCADLFKHPGILQFRSGHKFEAFDMGEVIITPLPLIHSKPTWGYAIESRQGHRFAYLTDTLGLPDRTADFLRAWGPFDMAIDCSYPPTPEPSNHNDWTRALDCAEKVGARFTWLTHLSHHFDSWYASEHAPEAMNVGIAHDGLLHDVRASG